MFTTAQIDSSQPISWIDPGAFANRYSDLPHKLDALYAIPRKVILYDWEAVWDKLLFGTRRCDLEKWSIAALSSCIVSTTPVSLRVVDCRYFAIFLCLIFRHIQIPPCVCLGFAEYSAEPGNDPPDVA